PVELLRDVDESHRRHQRPDSVSRASLPGDQTGDDPDPVGRDLRELFRPSEWLEAMRKRDEHGGRRDNCRTGERKPDEQPPVHDAPAASSASAAVERSSLRMKPFALLRSSRAPNSAASRLQVSAPTAPAPLGASAPARGSPSWPGNRTSGGRGWGGRSVRGASAAPPSWASRTPV